MSEENKYSGGCICGDVQIEVTGEPEGAGYCHCDSCRHWGAAPINAFTLWKPENVKVTKGEDNLGVYNKTPKSDRKWCKTCGGHVLTVHPDMGLVDVYAAVIPDFPFKPGIHVHYQETVCPMEDGLPKFKDLPAEAGGSGEEIPE